MQVNRSVEQGGIPIMTEFFMFLSSCLSGEVQASPSGPPTNPVHASSVSHPSKRLQELRAQIRLKRKYETMIQSKLSLLKRMSLDINDCLFSCRCQIHRPPMGMGLYKIHQATTMTLCKTLTQTVRQMHRTHWWRIMSMCKPRQTPLPQCKWTTQCKWVQWQPRQWRWQTRYTQWQLQWQLKWRPLKCHR